MDRRITIALVVVLALLGGYIWYTFGRSDAPPINPPTPAPTPFAFFKFDDTQLTAVQVRDVKNNKTTRVVRKDNAWKMESPAQGDANASRIERVTYDLSLLNAERKLDAPEDLSAFGLKPPAYEVQLTFQDGSTHTMSIGSQNPDKNYYYAMKDSDAAVYLIQSSTGDEVSQLVTEPPFTPTPEPTEPPTETPAPTQPQTTPTP